MVPLHIVANNGGTSGQHFERQILQCQGAAVESASRDPDHCLLASGGGVSQSPRAAPPQDLRGRTDPLSGLSEELGRAASASEPKPFTAGELAPGSLRLFNSIDP